MDAGEKEERVLQTVPPAAANLPRLLGQGAVGKPKEDPLQSLQKEAQSLREMQQTIAARLRSLEHQLEQTAGTDDTLSVCSDVQQSSTHLESDLDSESASDCPTFLRVKTEPISSASAHFDRTVSAPNTWDMGGNYRICVKNSFIDVQEECGDAVKRASSVPARTVNLSDDTEEPARPLHRQLRSLRTSPADALCL